MQVQRRRSILRTFFSNHIIVGDSEVYYTLNRRYLFINGPRLVWPWFSNFKLLEMFVQNLVHHLWQILGYYSVDHFQADIYFTRVLSVLLEADRKRLSELSFDLLQRNTKTEFAH